MTALVRWDGKDYNNPIHQERPFTIEIAHARGHIQGDNQGRGLPSPWLNFDPESELTLSCMDRLMIHEKNIFLLVGFTFLLSSQVFYRVLKWLLNII